MAATVAGVLAALVVNQSSQVRGSASAGGYGRTEEKLTTTLPGLGDVLRGTPSLRPVPADLPTCSLSVPG